MEIIWNEYVREQDQRWLMLSLKIKLLLLYLNSSHQSSEQRFLFLFFPDLFVLFCIQDAENVDTDELEYPG